MIDPAGYNKVVVITGCSSGIGLQTTLTFLSHQYRVFGIDVNAFDYALLEKFEGGKYQEHFHFHRADLSTPEAARESVAICVQQYGPKIDVLINNAGILDSFAATDTFIDDEFDRVIAINLGAPLKMMRAVLPFMKGRDLGGECERTSGSIINVGSKASVSGAASGLIYTASKHGLLGATKHTAWRFKDTPIRCNAVLPGSVETNLATSTNQWRLDLAALATLQPVHALHTAPDVESATTTKDVANAILFLASDESKSISGIALPIDRAWSTM